MAAENGDGVQGCSVRTNSNHKSMLLEMDRILDATKMQGVALTRADAVLNAQLAIGYERQCSERRPGLRNAASDGTTRSVPPASAQKTRLGTMDLRTFCIRILISGVHEMRRSNPTPTVVRQEGDVTEFEVGDRVRLSELGVLRNPRLKVHTGKVVEVPKQIGSSTVGVLFDGNKLRTRLHCLYVELDDQPRKPGDLGLQG